MKATLLLCLLGIFALTPRAQNLVMNPSFETEVGCPGVSMLSQFANWRDPWVNLIGDTCSTSDSYRVGGGFLCGGTFILGATTARTGTRVAGVITYSGFAFAGCTPIFTDNWREYAEGQLTSPLVAGQTYCISIWIKLASSVKWATNRMGVHMSNSLVTYGCNTTGGDSHLQSKGIIPQVESATVVTNTAGWTNLTWSYLATGGEQFITIGNFRNAAGTTRVDNNCGAINPYGYYYLDDISVTLGACMVLPVELSSFEGQCESNSVALEWETAGTDALDSPFAIERSSDSDEWEEIGRVEARTNGSGRYRYVDQSPFSAAKQAGPTFYRLRQTDLNGIHQYSQVLTVKSCNSASEWALFPNPSNGNCLLSGQEDIRSIRITNVVGKTVLLKENINAAEVTLDLHDQAPGVYQVSVVGAQGNGAVYRLVRE